MTAPKNPATTGPPSSDKKASASSDAAENDRGSGVGFSVQTALPPRLTTTRMRRSAIKEVEHPDRASSHKTNWSGRSQQPAARPTSRRSGGSRSQQPTTRPISRRGGSVQAHSTRTDWQEFFKRHNTLHPTSEDKQSRASQPTPRAPGDDSERSIIPTAGSALARAAARTALDSSSLRDSRARQEQLSTASIAESICDQFNDFRALYQVFMDFTNVMLGPDNHVEIDQTYPKASTDGICQQTLITKKQYSELNADYLKLLTLQKGSTFYQIVRNIEQDQKISQSDDESQRLHRKSKKIERMLLHHETLKTLFSPSTSICGHVPKTIPKRVYIALLKYRLLPLPRLPADKHATLLTKTYDEFISSLHSHRDHSTKKDVILKLLPDKQVDWQCDRDQIDKTKYQGIVFLDWDDTLQCTWKSRRYSSNAARMAGQKDRLKVFFSELKKLGMLPVILTARTKFVGHINDPCEVGEFPGVHIVYTACSCPKARVIDYYKRKTGIRQTHFFDDNTQEIALTDESTACTTISADKSGDLDYIHAKLQSWMASWPIAAAGTTGAASAELDAEPTKSTRLRRHTHLPHGARLPPLPKRATTVDMRAIDESTAGTAGPTI